MEIDTASFEDLKSDVVKPLRTENTRLLKRRQMLCLQLASYSLSSSVLLVYAIAGTSPFTVPSLFFISGIATTTIFAWSSESGFSDRFRDHYMTIPQAATNLILQLVFLAQVPEMGVVLLCLMFVTFGFAALRMTSLEAGVLLAVTGLGVACIFTQYSAPLLLPLGSPIEALAGVLMFIVTVGQCVYIGLFGNSMRQKLQRRSVELRIAYRRIEELAATDELTGLPNRRSMIKSLEEEVLRGQRGHQFSVAIIDLDWFKRINDRFGHPTGDEVLKTFAISMFANARATDKLGRYGGEEFLLIFSGTAVYDAKRSLERLRNIIQNLDWSSLTEDNPVTFSAGVTSFNRNDCADTLLHRADKALYVAKAEGRNRVAVDFKKNNDNNQRVN